MKPDCKHIFFCKNYRQDCGNCKRNKALIDYFSPIYRHTEGTTDDVYKQLEDKIRYKLHDATGGY